VEAFTGIFGALSIFFLLRSLASKRGRKALALELLGVQPEKDAKSLSRWRESLNLFLTWLGRSVPGRHADETEQLLLDSDFKNPASYLRGMRLAFGFFGFLAALPLGAPALFCGPALFAICYHLPVFLLKRRRKSRLEKIGSDLPEVVDLMSVLCFSGESLFQALSHATAACGHLSSQSELQEIVDRIRFGESTAQALKQAADHSCPELRRFGRVVARAEEYGAPVADTLEGLASEFKSARREKERVRAARASVLILFPLVFLILPSFLLLTVGAMILGYGL
jgi:Flp pilus assembly protein TadB